MNVSLTGRFVDGTTLIGPVGALASCPQGTYTLFTGRIDNRAELSNMLPGSIDPACSDAALYALARNAFGGATDLKVVGNYAAIIWSPNTKSIDLVRSPISAPPLHFWLGKNTVIVASVPRAIFATEDVAQEIDQQKIADSLFLNYTEAERSWFRDVSRMPTGTCSRISKNGVERLQTYDPFDSDPVLLPSDDDYVDAANAPFDDATRAVLRGSSKPAVSLSGGLDSQAVASFAMQATSSSLHGFTSVPEAAWDGRSRKNKFGDERAHVEAFAAMYPQLKTEFVDAAGLSFDYNLDAMFLMAGAAPRNAMNLHWIHEIHARAKAAQCDVLLTGGYGNVTFSFNGDGAFPEWIRQGHWGRALSEVWAGRRAHKTFAHAIAGKIIRPFLPRGVAKSLSSLRRGPAADVFETWCPLNPEWAADMKVIERAQAMGYDPAFRPLRSSKDVRRAMLGNAGNEAGELTQAMELLSGIPVRDPTSYRPLLEFCFNIPNEQYIRKGRRRWLARRMLKNRLPGMVLNEKRRGQQSADWHARLTRQRTDLRAELDRLSEDPLMSDMLNIDRLSHALDNWPDETPTDPNSLGSYVHLALSRGLTTARFIGYVTGQNA